MKFKRGEILVLVTLVGVILLLFFLLGGVGYVYRTVDGWITAWRYRNNPPSEAVFVPQQGVENGAPGFPQFATQAPAVETEGFLPTIAAAETTPVEVLPARVLLQGVTYTDQHGKWNYCAPANLVMALSYWGVEMTREEAAAGLKPYEEDKNVNPGEMVDFVVANTNLRALLRMGGTVNLLKQLTAAGYPVLVETGVVIRDVSTGQLNWAGHYMLVVGYDDANEEFITRDSYYSPPDYPLDFPVSYTELRDQWRGFNGAFLVLFPAEHEGHLWSVLGGYADEQYAMQQAFQHALDELQALSGEDQFLAAYNYAETLLAMGDAASAASAFDEAFRLYADLDPAQRPWRILWYRAAPYDAYYRMARYHDVINLATTTIESTPKPYLEESWTWRGMAYAALGETEKARADFEQALAYHAGCAPALAGLAQLP